MDEKEYVLTMIDQMSDEELQMFNSKFRIVDLGGELKNKIIEDSYHESDMKDMYHFLRDEY